MLTVRRARLAFTTALMSSLEAAGTRHLLRSSSSSLFVLFFRICISRCITSSPSHSSQGHLKDFVVSSINNSLAHRIISIGCRMSSDMSFSSTCFSQYGILSVHSTNSRISSGFGVPSAFTIWAFRTWYAFAANMFDPEQVHYTFAVLLLICSFLFFFGLIYSFFLVVCFMFALASCVNKPTDFLLV